MARRIVLPWRKDPAILARLTHVAKLRSKGVPVEEIAASQAVSVETVYVDMRRIKELWRESSTRALEEIKAEQLAEIQQIKRAAWETYDSLRDSSTRNKVESLNTLLKAVEREGKIHGTDAPAAVKAEVQVSPHERTPVDPASVVDVLSVLARAGALPSLSGPGAVLPPGTDRPADRVPADEQP